MTLKLLGWERQLIGYVREVSSQSFRPGTLDCAMFFGGAMLAMTGKDYLEPWKGKYRTIDEAMQMLSDMGYADHIEYVASILPELPSPLMAQRGDCAVVNDVDGNPALGVVQGENIYVMTLNGLSLAKLETAIRAFRV